MAFLENAADGEDLRAADRVRDLIVRAQTAKDRGEDTDLVQVIVRYRRENVAYEEAPIVIPRDALSSLYRLASAYLSYRTLRVHANTGNADFVRCVFLTPDQNLYIEVTHKDHQPEQNQDDQRRASLRGRRSQVDTFAADL